MTQHGEQDRLDVIAGSWRTKDEDGKHALIDELGTLESPGVQPQAAKLIDEIQTELKLEEMNEVGVPDHRIADPGVS